MKMPWRNLEGSAKLITICAAIFLVAGGLCGMQIAVMNYAPRLPDVFASVFVVAGVIELAAMGLSAIVMVVAAAVSVGTAFVTSFSKQGREPQKLFEDSDDGSTPRS